MRCKETHGDARGGAYRGAPPCSGATRHPGQRWRAARGRGCTPPAAPTARAASWPPPRRTRRWCTRARGRRAAAAASTRGNPCSRGEEGARAVSAAASANAKVPRSMAGRSPAARHERRPVLLRHAVEAEPRQQGRAQRHALLQPHARAHPRAAAAMGSRASHLRTRHLERGREDLMALPTRRRRIDDAGAAVGAPERLCTQNGSSSKATGQRVDCAGLARGAAIRQPVQGRRQ